MSGCSIYNKSVKHLCMCILSYLNYMYIEGFYNIQEMHKIRWNVYYCLKKQCKKILLARWEIKCTFVTTRLIFHLSKSNTFAKAKKSISWLSIPNSYLAAEINLTNEKNTGTFVVPKINKYFHPLWMHLVSNEFDICGAEETFIDESWNFVMIGNPQSPR